MYRKIKNERLILVSECAILIILEKKAYRIYKHANFQLNAYTYIRNFFLLSEINIAILIIE